MKELVGKFGERNPFVGTIYRDKVLCKCRGETSDTSTS